MNAKTELKEIFDRWFGLPVKEDRPQSKLYAENSKRAFEILSTHDLFPIDAGEFRPEDFGFVQTDSLRGYEFYTKDGYTLQKVFPSMSPTGTTQFILYKVAEKPFAHLDFWPSRQFAALLLRELGITGGQA